MQEAGTLQLGTSLGAAPQPVHVPTAAAALRTLLFIGTPPLALPLIATSTASCAPTLGICCLQGDGSVIPGLEAALLGMRPGGKRRALIPPEVGYLAGPGLKPGMPTFATQRQLENHKNEPLLFEYQVLRVGEARG